MQLHGGSAPWQHIATLFRSMERREGASVIETSIPYLISPAIDLNTALHQRITVKLRRNEYCPIHRSVSCCGREQTPYALRLQPGIRRIEDPHHPRGYRELRSPAEMRKLLNRKIAEQDRRCAICHEEFTDYNDVVPDHRNPKGMGGAWRDDHPDNIQATHSWCNEEKGSTRME